MATMTFLNPGQITLDAALRILDDLDSTKVLQFQASGITTATTRTVTAQDASGTMYISGGTDIPVTDGGTGASTAAAAATNLGLGVTDVPTFGGLNLYF